MALSLKHLFRNFPAQNENDQGILNSIGTMMLPEYIIPVENSSIRVEIKLKYRKHIIKMKDESTRKEFLDYWDLILKDHQSHTEKIDQAWAKERNLRNQKEKSDPYYELEQRGHITMMKVMQIAEDNLRLLGKPIEDTINDYLFEF